MRITEQKGKHESRHLHQYKMIVFSDCVPKNTYTDVNHVLSVRSMGAHVQVTARKIVASLRNRVLQKGLANSCLKALLGTRSDTMPLVPRHWNWEQKTGPTFLQCSKYILSDVIESFQFQMNDVNHSTQVRKGCIQQN